MTPEEISNKINMILERVKVQAVKVLCIEGEKSIKMNFEAGGRPEKWAARKRESKKQKGRKLLVITGRLSNVRGKELKDSAQFITDARARDYARLQNEGGVINMPARIYKFRDKRNKSGKTVSVFAGESHKRIRKETRGKPYRITIPKREFMVIPQSDFQRILNQLKAGIKIW